jgi:hypothetical protein
MDGGVEDDVMDGWVGWMDDIINNEIERVKKLPACTATLELVVKFKLNHPNCGKAIQHFGF